MQLKHRKNFLPAVIISLICWGIVSFFIGFVDPEVIKDFPITDSYSIFFIFLFMALFFTLALVLANSRRGFLFAIGIIIFLYLRILGIGHALNAILLFSFLLVLELAISRK